MCERSGAGSDSLSRARRLDGSAERAPAPESVDRFATPDCSGGTGTTCGAPAGSTGIAVDASAADGCGSLLLGDAVIGAERRIGADRSNSLALGNNDRSDGRVVGNEDGSAEGTRGELLPALAGRAVGAPVDARGRVGEGARLSGPGSDSPTIVCNCVRKFGSLRNLLRSSGSLWIFRISSLTS